MSVYRAQIATSQDTVEPKDRIMITPHFRVVGTSTMGHPAFVDDVISKWTTYLGGSPAANELTVKLYDAEAPAPNYPLVEKTVRAGVAAASLVNRDVAMCLSYFATNNRPRTRGRIYVPCSLAGITPSSSRPSAANQTRVSDLATVLAAMGGSEYIWAVWSRVDRVARNVTDWWVDNSWDSQRRRGLRGTSRTTGSITG